MKSESEIREMIRNCDSGDSDCTKCPFVDDFNCYDAMNALRWVLEEAQ